LAQDLAAGPEKHSRTSAVRKGRSQSLDCPSTTPQLCSQDLHGVGSCAHPQHWG